MHVQGNDGITDVSIPENFAPFPRLAGFATDILSFLHLDPEIGAQRATAGSESETAGAANYRGSLNFASCFYFHDSQWSRQTGALKWF